MVSLTDFIIFELLVINDFFSKLLLLIFFLDSDAASVSSFSKSSLSLSMRSPIYTGCRKIPSFVFSVNFISQTSSGLNQVAGALVFGTFSNGQSLIINGLKVSYNDSKVLSEKPVPACPQYSNRSLTKVPKMIAPKFFLPPVGSVKPQIKTSSVFWNFIFNQSELRTPSEYILSAFFAIIPSNSIF